MTPEQFAACAAATTKQYGIVIVGWQGQGSVAGVTASMNYDGHTLTVDVKRKPWLLPLSLCERYLNAWLDAFAPATA